MNRFLLSKALAVLWQNIVYDYFRLPETKVLIEEIKTLGLNTQAEKKSKSETNALFEGKTFVITGTLKNYKRTEAASIIEQLGGKTSSSVSKKPTLYLLVKKLEVS